MPRFPFLPSDHRFYELLRESAKNLVDASEVLLDLFEHYENIGMKTDRISELEHKGDTSTHELMALLHKTFVTPIESEDTTALAQRLDDVMDSIEGASTAMRIYKIKAPTGKARELADVLRLMAVKVSQAIGQLRDRGKLREILPLCVELNRLENVADDLFRNAMAELFDTQPNAAEIIKWREIYESLETATDRCEDVANILEGIVLRHA